MRENKHTAKDEQKNMETIVCMSVIGNAEGDIKKTYWNAIMAVLTTPML